MRTKVLVTGANGFVGRHLLGRFSKNKVEIIAVIRNENSDISAIENIDGVRIVYCDMKNISDLESLVSDRDIDSCIHLAWDGATGEKRGDFEVQMSNIHNTISLCEVLARMKVKTFIGVGTLAEKDTNNYIPMDGATPNKVANYGIAKLSAHYFSKTICHNLGLRHIWCELSNVYGPGDRTNNFVNMALHKMLNGERAAFTKGEQMYDFVYITDVAKAIYCVWQKGKNNMTYYVGSCQQKKLKEFVAIMRDTIDKSIPLYLGEIPFNGICLPDEEFSCEKLCADTGYIADVKFEEGIRNTLKALEEE